VNVEYAGSSSHGDQRMTRAAVLARAPEWWRKLADRGLRSAAAAKASPVAPAVRSPAPPKTLGWICGIACCGVSEPVTLAGSQSTMRETFQTEALAGMAKQAGSGERSIPLRWGHHGEVVTTTTGLNLLFRVRQVAGFDALYFEARLSDTALNRRVLKDFEQGVIGASLGFTGADVWTTERRGYGPVRVIRRARLDHLALLPTGSKQTPAYRAAWAAGCRSSGPGCPVALRQKVESRAWEELVRQAKVMG